MFMDKWISSLCLMSGQRSVVLGSATILASSDNAYKWKELGLQ